MDLNDYVVEKLVEGRLAELRADAARMRWVAQASAGTPRPARGFGAWLMDSARWLVNAPRPPAPLSPPSGAGGA
jgi:hypothetical protein